MKRTAIYAIILIVIAAAIYVFSLQSDENEAVGVRADYKEAEYFIDGERVTLGAGGTRYFGNEVRKDLDGDGDEDVAFLITRDTGGSGTFFYAVGALKTDGGYVGTDAVFLGDRIAPQSTVSGPGRSIVINYADGKSGEPMTAQSSQGKSMRLLLDPESRTWGEVAADFEGEADPSRMSLGMKEWVWQRTELNDGSTVAPKAVGRFTVTFVNDGTFSATTDCNRMFGSYTAKDGMISFSGIGMTKMFCEGSQEDVFAAYLRDASEYLFTSRGELVLGLKFDSGSVIFK